MSRQAVVDFALKHAGQPAPEEMWLRVLGYVPRGRVHWCGLFCVYCIGAALDLDLPRWLPGTGVSQYGWPRTQNPMPGDIAIFARSWHHALVDFDPDPYDDRVPLINGNAGPAPGHVALSTKPRSAVTYYVSIAHLLER